VADGNQDLVIREATLDDHEDIARLYIQLKEHHRKLQPGSPRYNVVDERWGELAKDEIENPHVFVYIAEMSRRIVGFMKFIFKEKPWGISCEIETMVVDKSHRGKAIGKSLLETAERYARENGAKGLRVDVLIPNYDGRRFYETHGYESISVRYGKPIRD
jgi:ribosomal protein S18 acetylase RimI-like enzyme